MASYDLPDSSAALHASVDNMPFSKNKLSGNVITEKVQYEECKDVRVGEKSAIVNFFLAKVRTSYIHIIGENLHPIASSNYSATVVSSEYRNEQIHNFSIFPITALFKTGGPVVPKYSRFTLITYQKQKFQQMHYWSPDPLGKSWSQTEEQRSHRLSLVTNSSAIAVR